MDAVVEVPVAALAAPMMRALKTACSAGTRRLWPSTYSEMSWTASSFFSKSAVMTRMETPSLARLKSHRTYRGLIHGLQMRTLSLAPKSWLSMKAPAWRPT
jgi:hypothetical protein